TCTALFSPIEPESANRRTLGPARGRSALDRPASRSLDSPAPCVPAGGQRVSVSCRLEPPVDLAQLGDRGRTVPEADRQPGQRGSSEGRRLADERALDRASELVRDQAADEIAGPAAVDAQVAQGQAEV